ncbi:MAG: hydrogenase iron-sulfur subunit [Chloroflexota bacterium]|nr:hydrogenase iron-sulfur subunit [Chloroflexota bacterium]
MSEFEPRILCFACNWCSYAAADIAGTSRLHYPSNVRVIRVMCSGMVSPEYVLKAFEEGFDGVMIAGCHIGDCHYISGNMRAEERIEKLKKLLHTLGLEDERLLLRWIATSEGPLFAETITQFVGQLKKVGPSPFRKELVA